MPVHIAIPRTISTDARYNSYSKKDFEKLNFLYKVKIFIDKSWMAFKYNSESNFNYGQIKLFNKTHLNWSFMLPNDTVIDSVTIIKVR